MAAMKKNGEKTWNLPENFFKCQEVNKLVHISGFHHIFLISM